VEYDDTTMFNFEKLEVWNEAITLAGTICRLTKGFPEEEPFGLTSRSTLSPQLSTILRT
jgi:hypothetical protein